jgi:hypothetical protein
MAPIAMPSRSLKLAIDRRARLIDAFWPEMTASSSAASSSSLALVFASPY